MSVYSIKFCCVSCFFVLFTAAPSKGPNMPVSATEWKKAPRPNYTINHDLEYPYSECPYLGEYDLVKLPKEGLLNHVSYWGEGRIEKNGKVGGFPNSYNVNLEYQLVSDGGANIKDRKIPNRIPITSSTDCRTDSYIKDNSVRFVTVMGNSINTSCANDIARIINKAEGIVVVYGMNNTDSISKLQNALKPRGLVYLEGYELPVDFQEVTMYDSIRVFVNLETSKNQLYDAITDGKYNKAIILAKELSKANYDNAIAAVVERLLETGTKTTMDFAYKLWSESARDILTKSFPTEFQNILKSDDVKIISNNYGQALKLDSKTDEYNDRQAWGDANDKTSANIAWKFMPLSESNGVSFNVKNNQYIMYLKLDSKTDEYGDRKCWGSVGANNNNHKWTLIAKKCNGKVLFFIVNNEYKQGLKLDSNTDSYGDRLVWGHSKDVTSDPEHYGWRVEPY